MRHLNKVTIIIIYYMFPMPQHHSFSVINPGLIQLYRGVFGEFITGEPIDLEGEGCIFYI